MDDIAALMASHDLVVAADGVNSKARGAFAHVFKPDIDLRKCRYTWLGTRAKFDDAFTFIFEETEHGWIWGHAYQFDAETLQLTRLNLLGIVQTIVEALYQD